MTHTEAERQFYLGMAGVSLWYAREHLPGAAPSPEFVFPEEVSTPVPEPGVQPVAREFPRPVAAEVLPTGPGGAHGKPDLQALMVGGKESKVPEPKPVSETESRALPEVAGGSSEDSAGVTDVVTRAEAIPLNLKAWGGNRFCLACGLADDASNRLQETLALNIMKSIGEVAPSALGPLRWPVFNNVKVPGNSSSDLASVMSDVFTAFKGRTLILLHSGDESSTGKIEQLLLDAGLDQGLVYRHSLAELSSSPELKRALWSQLRPLAAG